MTADAPRIEFPRLRRVIVWVIVIAFGIAAIGGIIVLLGGSLDETSGRVLATTATVGGYSVAVLCCAALGGRRLQWFGFLGVAITLVTAILSIILIWADYVWNDGWDLIWRSMWTGLTLTAAWSLASLLLLLADRRRTAVVWGLRVTLALFVPIVGMVIYLIWLREGYPGEWFPRTLGVFGILAALGAITVPVLSIVLPDTRPAPEAPPVDGAGLDPTLAARLIAEADRRGITVAELVAPVIENGPRG